MAVRLLSGAGASVTSPGVVTRPVVHKLFPMRLCATGNYAGEKVYFEHSPDNGATWIALGDIAAAGTDLFIDGPVDMIRARTGAFTSGTASAYIIPGA